MANDVFDPASIFQVLNDRTRQGTDSERFIGTGGSLESPAFDIAALTAGPKETPYTQPKDSGILDTSFMRAQLAADRMQSREGKKNLGGLLSAGANDMLGTTPAQGNAPAGLDLNTSIPWADVIKSKEWDKLPWDERAKQSRAWGDTRVAEQIARIEASTGAPLKATDRATLKADIQKQIRATIGEKPSFEYSNTDWLDSGVLGAKRLLVDRQIRNAQTPGERARAIEEQAKLTAEYNQVTSEYTKDEEKRLAFTREKMQKENLAKTGSPELTVAQEAQLGWSSFSSAPIRFLAGSAPSTIAGISAALAGGAVGSVVPLIGSTAGAAAGGVAAGQELLSAEIAGGTASDVNQLTPEQLSKSPKYQNYLAQHNGDPRLAKAAFIGDLIKDIEPAARLAGAVSGGADAFIGAGSILRKATGATGAVLKPLIAKALAKEGITDVLMSAPVKTIASALEKEVAEKGVARAAGLVARPLLAEGVQEFAEEGGGQVLQNVAQQRGGLEQSTFEGAVEAGVAGALSGIGMGAGAKMTGKALGPIQDNGDLVVGKDAKGMPALVRQSKLAASSNWAYNQDTGFSRLRNLDDAETDPSAIFNVRQNNTALMQGLAVSSGMSRQAGVLAGAGINSILLNTRGDTTSILDSQGNVIEFATLPDGSLTALDANALTPSGVQILNQANGIVSTLRNPVTQFAQRTTGWVAPEMGTVEPTPSPIMEPAPSPITEPAPSPITEPAPSPITEPAPSPITEPAPSPITEPAPSPITEPAPSPIMEPAPSPITEPTPSPITEPTPSPITEPTPSPITEPTPSPITEPTPSPITEPTSIPTPDVFLPSDLVRAQPRFNIGATSYIPSFESDVDRASYIARNGANRSTRDSDYVNFVAQATGMTEAQVRTHGDLVAAAIRREANALPQGGIVNIPRQVITPAAPLAATSTPVSTEVRRLSKGDQKVLERLEKTAGQANTGGEPSQAGAMELASEMALLFRASPKVARLYNIGRGLPPNLDWARNSYGMAVGLAGALSQPWAMAVISATNPLDAMANDPLAGEANRVAAAAVQSLYRESGIRLPSVAYAPPARRSALGTYSRSAHQVSFNAKTTASTVPHEYLHGLTVEGLANASPDTVALITHLRSLLPKNLYASTANAEILAELFAPKALTAMSVLKVDLDAMPADARRAAERLLASDNLSLLELFARAVEGILQAAFPSATIPEGSISSLLVRVAAELTAGTASVEGLQAPIAPYTPSVTDLNYTAPRISAGLDAFYDRLSTLGRALWDSGKIRSSAYLDNSATPIPQRALPLRASVEQKRDGLRTFMSAYTQSANAKLQELLASASTLAEKQKVANTLFGINAERAHPGAYLTSITLTSGAGSSLASTNTMRFSYTLPDGQIKEDIAIVQFASRGGTKVSATRLKTGSGEGTIFYDALYGSAVYAGVPVKVRALTMRNIERMPLNRLRATLKWGSFYRDVERAAKVLQFNVGNVPLGLDSLFQRFESQINRAVRGESRGLRVDENTGGLLAGDARTPVDEVGAFIEGETLGINTEGWPGTTPVTPNALRLAASIRSMLESNNPSALASTVAQGDVFLSVADGDMEGQDNMLEPDEDAEDGTSSKGEPAAPADTRPTAGALLQDIQTGSSASAASSGRKLKQSLLNPKLQRNEKVKALAEYAAKVGDKALELFADSLMPMLRWTESLSVPAPLRQKIIDGMYAAPGIRDYILKQAVDVHGGKDLSVALADILANSADKTVTTETVTRDVGYWATAVYSKIKNQRMLDTDRASVIAAEKALADAMSTGATAEQQQGLQLAVDNAKEAYRQRDFALSQPATVTDHFGGTTTGGRVPPKVNLAAGMNYAQADAFAAYAERKYGKAAIEKASKALYRMNAYRMAVDLEHGRTTPSQAAAFSPELKVLYPEMVKLHSLATSPSRNQVALENARQRFVDRLAATSQYVPTTGDPAKGFEMDMLGSGSSAPNTAQDKRLQGRSSISDDGITATIGGVQRAAAAAGWNDFSEGIAQAYALMSPAERTKAGLQAAPATIVNRITDNVVIRGDTAYKIKDGLEISTLRKANLDGTSSLMQGLQFPTRAFAYAATQLNPTFGPVNMARDVWERSENMRTRKYLDAKGNPVDASKAASRMLKLAASMQVFNDISAYVWMGNKTSKFGVLMREFEELGGTSAGYSAITSRERVALVKDIESLKSKPARGLKALGTFVSNYNAAFEMVSSVSAYASLREQGMTPQAAAAAALDLMNYRKSGAAMPFVRTLYAFAQPAVTGGVALAKTLKTKDGRVRMVGYIVAMAVLQSLLASIAGDDERLGTNKMDLLDEYTKDRSLPIPLGPDLIAKLPIAYGLPMLANVISRASAGFVKGDIDLSQALSDVGTRGLMPAFTPLEDSKIPFSDDPIGYTIQTFTPTVVKPLANVGINKTGLGERIRKDEFLKRDEFLSAQGSPLTADFYRDTAVFIRKNLGMDLLPEQVKEIVRGYMPGIFGTALKVAVDNPQREMLGKQAATPPILDRFVSGYNPNAVSSQFKSLEYAAIRIRKELNADANYDLSVEDAQKLELYEEWEAQEKLYRTQAKALTKAGVSKGLDPARTTLREFREGTQIDILRQLGKAK